MVKEKILIQKFEHKNWLLIGFIILIFFSPLAFIEKGADIKLLDPIINPINNAIFSAITFLGDGWFLIILSLIIFIKRRLLGSLLLLSYTFSGIITQVLKRFFQLPRPVKYFELQGLDIYKEISVPTGIELSKYLSFPSGHTTSAFAIAFTLIFNIQSKRIKYILIALAILIALSRMYLRQHFFIDVYVGAFIGMTASFIIQYLKPWMQSKFNLE